MHSNALLSRRRLVALSGALGATVVAVACGSAPPPTATPAPAKPAEPAKPTTAPATAPTAAPAAGATTAPAATSAPAAAAATKPAETSKPAAAAPATGPGQKYEITFLTTQTSPADVKIYEDLAKRFAELNPNLTVKVTAESGTNYDQKLLTYLTAGTLPDIVQTNDNYSAPFKKAGITRDMIPFAKGTNFPYQDFDPTFLNLGMVDGELHMLPKQGDVIVPYVNLRMAKEGNVELPLKLDPVKEPDKWTWDEFTTMVKHLTVDGNGKRGDQAGFDKENVQVYGAALQIDAWYTYVPMVLAEGGQFVSDDLSKSLLNSPQGVEAFKKLTEPVKAGYWAPPTLLQTMSNSGTVFAAGKAAMAPLQRLWCTTLRSQLKDDFDVIHFPKGTTKRVTGEGTFGFALTTKAKNPDLAWKFLDFMYGDEGMKIITSSYAAVPAMKRYYNSPFWRELPGPPYNNAVFVDAFQYGTTPPRLPFYSTGPFRQAVTDGLTAITLGKATAEEVVKNVDKVLNDYLQSQKK
ncbi:MAG TPA: sugar ABC transporter substrate-binding protein [Chloroflexota bacterium]|nr:sugar ABC transporter substrate-binding protein [Chloroflexota bacterium]